MAERSRQSSMLSLSRLSLLLILMADHCNGHGGYIGGGTTTSVSSAFVHSRHHSGSSLSWCRNNYHPKNKHGQRPHRSSTAIHWTLGSMATAAAAPRHTIRGIEYMEVTLELPVVGLVTVLEATAESQEVLVNLALALEGDADETDSDDGVGNGGITAQEQQQQQQRLQLQSGDIYGAVLWPASLAIASYLLTAVNIQNLTVLELGAGTGLVSMAACAGGARHVLATDYEEIPLQLLQYAAAHLNPSISFSSGDSSDSESDKGVVLECKLLDMCDTKAVLPYADWVVAADIMYEPNTGRAMAVRALEALQNGSRVLIGDSPGRAGRPAFLQELERLGIQGAAFVDTVGSTVTGDRHELICGKGSTTVSREPQQLTVAIMELDPKLHLPNNVDRL
jgi:predicted nicotinamide N-methyase